MNIDYGYARCSTNESKQDLMRQVREICAMGVEERMIFKEYEHGDKEDRTELRRLLEIVRPGDSIYCTEVSRLTRSMHQLLQILEDAHDRQFRLVIGGFVFDCRAGDADPMVESMLQMMGIFAELERKMIVQRVRSGMANAKAKGARIGRAKTTAADVPAAFRRNYERYRRGEVTFLDCCRMAQIGKTAGYKYRKLLDEERG